MTRCRERGRRRNRRSAYELDLKRKRRCAKPPAAAYLEAGLRSASPVALMHAPAAARANPGMGYPVVTRAARTPVAPNPDVPSTDPVPVAAEPHKAGSRCNADHFDLRCGRSDRDDPAPVIARRRRDYAAAQKRAG